MFSPQLTPSKSTTRLMDVDDDGYDLSASSMAYNYQDDDDENANDGIVYTMEVDESVTSNIIDEDSQDSGFSSDSFLSETSGMADSLYVATGPTDFTEISMKKSPDLPPTFSQNFDASESHAAAYLNYFCSSKREPLRAEPSGRRTPLKDILQSCTANNVINEESSPVSTKSNRNEFKISRKRSLRTLVSREIENPQLKRQRPSFHRAYSTSELEIQRNYDSSPEAAKYSLEIVNGCRPSDMAFGRIESSVLFQLMKTLGDKFHERYILVDCRYPFEFNGGHIKGAINLYDPASLRSIFYPATDKEFYDIHSKTPIFYCEYSSVRGPNMANALRELDRQLNHNRYPYVDYQEIYVLSQGYRHFYHNDERFCEPQSYIPMKSKQYVKELQRYSFHQKSAPIGLSIRSRSTHTLMHSKSVNLSPCFCQSICTCLKSSSPILQRLLGDEFSQFNIRSPQRALLSPQGPLPFCVDDSPFASTSSKRRST